MANTLDLVNAYVGTTQLSKLYQGSNLLWEYDSSADMAYNYLQMPNNLTMVYFDTGYIPTEDTVVEAKYEVTVDPWNVSSQEMGYLFASDSSGNSVTDRRLGYDICQLHSNTGQSQAYGFVGYIGRSAYKHSSTTVVPPVNTPITMKIGYNIAGGSKIALQYTVQGSSTDTLLASSTGKPSYVSSMPSIYLLAMNQAGSATKRLYMGTKVYYFKIYEGNTLTRHYIPVRHDNNGTFVNCLYDKVTGNYLYKSGGGTLIYG